MYESRNRRAYFDSGPIDQIFGADSRERMLDETDGHGYASPDANGDLWSRNPKTKEVERVDDELLDRVWLGGDLEHEAG